MGLTRISGDVIQTPLNVGVVTATRIDGNVSGNVNSTGISTFTTLRVGTAVTISGGIVTATSFVGNITGNVTGNATGLSGTPNITVGNIIASSATISGNVSVAGTVTYDDVTNVDSLGVGTFRSGIVVNTGTASTALIVNGSSRITGILSVGQGTITINGNTDKITTPKLDYAGISSTITATAVDVFVYDTRKDSDGGAWRKRTQHTSWYNETLNTATRGSRRDFPAVAVLVLTSSTLTIYDGDDPDMPMWMVFNTVNGMIYTSGNNLTSVSMLNGTLVWTGFRSGIINFISESAELLEAGYAYTLRYGIVNRNVSATWNSTTGRQIVNNTCNDVAMTVLPNAPIDSITGLPVPTIAVATNGGFSVIKDDETVINKVVSGTVTNKVDWYKNIYLLGTGPEYWALYKDLSAESGGYISDTADLYSAPNQSGWDKPQPSSLETRVAGANDLIVGAGSGGITLKQPPLSLSNGTTSLLCGITSSYNTGWMHGNIKGAFLSDTSTTSVTGTTVYSDTFDNNNNGWGFADNGSSGISGGVMTIEQNGSARATDSDAFSGGTTGTKYALEVIIASGGTGNFQLDDDGIGAGLAGVTAYATYSSTGTFTAIITKTASNRLRFLRSSGTGNYTITSITIKPLQEADRSVNNNGLAVYGTITKTAVATGADLVAYGGFSISNYLLQPYNSAIAFGTADFSYMGWAKATTAGGYLFQWDNPNSASGIRISMFNSTTVRVTVTSVVDRDITYSALTGTWNFFVVQRVGSIIYTYINGVQIDSFSNTTNLSGTDKVLTFGYNGNSTLNLALWRVSASVPSPDQIKKIYNDEKMLFQENSKATLYGTSSAVTALAYDDSTRLLYAGTSSGRSDFQGLERINNTTTAVTTAISASNGLVAEQ